MTPELETALETVWRAHAYAVSDRNELKALLATVVAHLEAEMRPLKAGNAPGHAHQIPGVWDRSGTACEWCALWQRVKARLDEA